MLTLDSGACNIIPFSALGDPRAVREGSKRYVRLPSGKVARVISLNGVWVAEMGMLEYTTQSLPPVTGLPEGTEVFVGNYNGNIARLINGVWRYISPFIVDWASRPAANAVPIGTELQVTDYANQKWISDGTYWRPAQGRVTIGQQWGDYASPLAVLSATTAAQFTIPGGNPLIPAGMIIPHSSLRVFTTAKKIGGTATASLQCRVGTANNMTDSLFGAVTPSATATNLDIQLASAARFRGLSGRLAALQYAGDGLSTGTVGAGNDFTANLNTSADMRVSFSMNVGNVADTYNLIGYNVWLEA